MSNLSRILDVPEALFFMIGGGTLISSSVLSWEQMAADTISIGVSSEIDNNWPVLYNIRLERPECYIIIEEDCSYKDFKQRVFESSSNHGLDIHDFQLVDEYENDVDFTTWLDYLSSGEVEQKWHSILRLASKPEGQQEFAHRWRDGS
ncbi:hypothetical protein Forpe1208_v013984 [Fusarium oxysporum f. sp. rapae]|uniref:Uncharacterized protein n=1 Tax=Fusarium oxysporum f. sp. rapae TaxID=485398 RepID=A0A8J5TZT6_FUSOX|nr:hypothetical protein Forpe1208_v013984 [Fusarium oxysporum f. sp. rapae]